MVVYLYGNFCLIVFFILEINKCLNVRIGGI